MKMKEDFATAKRRGACQHQILRMRKHLQRVEDRGGDSGKFLRGVDAEDSAAGVLQNGAGLFVVDVDSVPDHFLVGVVGAVFGLGSAFHSFDYRRHVVAEEVDDPEDVDLVREQRCLSDSARDAIEDDLGAGGVQGSGGGEGINTFLPEPDRKLIGDEATRFGILSEGFPEVAGRIQGRKTSPQAKWR